MSHIKVYVEMTMHKYENHALVDFVQIPRIHDENIVSYCQLGLLAVTLS